MGRNLSYRIFIIAFLYSLVLISCQGNKSKDNKSESLHLQSLKSSDTIQQESSYYLCEKALTDYLMSTEVIVPNSKNGQPFGKLDYDKVIAYEFDGSEEPYPMVIDELGNFVPVILKQKCLTQQQADKIFSTLASTSTYGEGTAACFQPHLALVIYKNNDVLHQISICLGCNYLLSDIKIPATESKKEFEGTEQKFPLNGFTQRGKEKIISFCKELGFVDKF